MLKRYLARRALERSLRPDPERRDRMLAQWPRERQERYWRNIELALRPKGECAK